jgi:hypothetical protein
MQFIVEDGTGVIGATSYASIQAADNYAGFWDHTEWDVLDNNEKEKLLIKATRYIDINLTFPKVILSMEQGLSWPRMKFIDNDGREIEGLPQQIVEAAIKIAILFNKGLDPNKQRKLLTSQSYGSSSESYFGAYNENYDNLDAELSDLIKALSIQGLAGRRLKTVLLERG